MLWDTHMHTNFSGDSDAAPELMIHQALKLGLSGICITDHLDLDYPNEPDLFLLNPVEYYSTLSGLQEKFKDQIPLLLGIEFGLQPHLSRKLQELASSIPFDFIIGSSHVVHGADPYYPSYYQDRDEHTAYLEYFESILENLKTCQDFDSYGHIDYVVRYGPDKNKNYSYDKYSDVLDEILKQLIEKGKALEVNTAGFKYRLGHPNPSEEVLKRYRELGGELLTIGSDAHTPQDMGYHFQKLPELLKSCGFRYYTIYKKRKPEFLPVPR